MHLRNEFDPACGLSLRELFSGYAMEEDLARALDAGFSAHVAKPVDPEELLTLVRKLTS